MKGLCVELNGTRKIFGTPSLDGGVLFIISIDKNEKEFKIDARGYDNTNNINYEWISEVANTNTSLKIQFLDSVDVNDFSEPIIKKIVDSKDFLLKIIINFLLF